MNETRSVPESWGSILVGDKPLICGILNVTPDSFSDGGNYSSVEEINSQIDKLISQGAKLIDVGAESTRPKAQEVLPSEEIDRLKNVVQVLKSKTFDGIFFSIDTRHHQTAEFAMENGFQIINDVSGATFDEKMTETMSKTKALVILMHSRGTPETMTDLAHYEDIVEDVQAELASRIAAAIKAGVSPEKIMIDPGIGFAKTPEQGLILMEKLECVKNTLGYPVMVGVSRKTIVSFKMTGDSMSVPFDQRDDVSAQMCTFLAEHDVDVVRVHNVAKTLQALKS